MFREFNVKFEDVEMLGGADNLLEGTEITKVIVRGDNNKMSSLDSMLKNCNELDTIDGELDLNGVSDIDNLLEGTELVKSINLKNINNENITANNSFPYVESINIGGEVYDKRAMQNVIASKDWTFDNITYSGNVGENLLAKSATMIDDDKTTIKNTLEQKARGFEIIGQTYENLVDGSGEATLLDELTLESIDGSPNEFTPHIEQSVCVETIEGETYQNLIEGKGEYKLTDTFSTTWTESNNSIDNPPSVIEIPEIWGNTVQGYANIVTAQQIVDSINNSAWTDGNSATLSPTDSKLYKVVSANSNGIDTNNISWIQLKANTTYSVTHYSAVYKGYFNAYVRYYENPSEVSTISSSSSFTTGSSGKVFLYPMGYQGQWNWIRVVEGKVNLSQYAYDEMDLSYIQSVGDLYVDEEGTSILDEEGNEQYKLEIESSTVRTNLLSENGKLKFSHGQLNSSGSVNVSNKQGCYTDYFIKAKLSQNQHYHFFVKDNLNINCGLYSVLMYDKDKKLLGMLGNNGSIPNGSKTNIVYYDNVEYIKIGLFNYTSGTVLDLDLINSASFCLAKSDVTEFSDDYSLSNKTTILMPQQLKKIGSIKKYHQSTGDKWYPACSKLYYDYNAQKFFMKHVPTIEHNILNVLTTMNPFVEFSTRSYNSEDYYLIDIFFSINNNKFGVLGRGGADDITFMLKTTYPLPLLTGREIGMNWGTSNTTKLEGYAFGFVAQYSHGWTLSLVIKATNFGDRTLDKAGVIDFFTTYPTSFVAIKNQDYTVYLETLDNVYDIVETKILEKPSLDAYSPKTYITTNTEIQPSKMTVTNKRNLIDLKKMKANTDYTVQLKCNEKGNKPIKINLCGKEKDVDATIGVNHVNITTNELNDNRLELSGEGNIVSEIIVVEGEMNQYPKYFNGVQSVGVLENGKYRIDIKTNESFNLSIHTNNPLTKGDKLYWNKSNKRYEIDKGGSIEVPTVSGDVIDLPRLYQKEDTNFTIESGNIKPSKTSINYLDID